MGSVCSRRATKGPQPKGMERPGGSLPHGGREPRSDREIVVEAVRQDRDAKIVHQDEAAVKAALAAIRQFGFALDDMNTELRGDRRVVMEAVGQEGADLEFASRELRNDREIVMEAVRQDGDALQHASQELRSDPEVVMTAVQQFGFALQHASEQLRSDRKIVTAAVQQFGEALSCASEELQNDGEMLAIAVKNAESESLGLTVVLSSGRSCSVIANKRFQSLEEVKRICGEQLGLDPEKVANHGSLFNGEEEVQSLEDLSGKKVYNIILVLG